MPLSQDIINLYDSFTHGQIDRREFMERLGRIAGGSVAAAAVLATLSNNYAQAAMVSEDDARLSATMETAGTVKAYVVRAKDAGKQGAVIVIHENRGLNPHIKDVARRVALEGFTAIAPDLLSSAGGTPEDQDKARDMIGKLDAAATLAELVALVAYAKARPDGSGKVGAVGFCWGGGKVNALAVASPDLAAGVAYYGAQPKAEDVPKIKASLLLHYAGKDDRINAGISAYEAALKAAKTDYQLFVYDGVNHAFNNDTSGERYNKAAADLAWGRTIGLFKAKLAG
jgi:carboxymethylenebutenolidase